LPKTKKLLAYPNKNHPLIDWLRKIISNLIICPRYPPDNKQNVKKNKKKVIPPRIFKKREKNISVTKKVGERKE
jgi:hypothetical protein